MKKKVRHNIKKTFILSIALLLGMIINIFGNNIINSLCEEIKLVKINTSWQYLKNDNSKESINLPVVIRETEKKDKIIIEKDISTIGYNDPTLLLRSELQSIDIYINGKCSSKIRKSNKQLFGKEKESGWIFVSLPHNENNINIKLEFSSEYLDYNGRINSIILGDKSNEIIYIVSSKVHKILAAIVLFSIGIILISIYFGSKKHDAMNYKKVLYLSLLNFCTSCWILLSSDILELFITDVIPRGELKLLSLFFIPVIFLLLFKENYNNRYIKVLNVILSLLLIYIVTSTLLHVFNVMHYIENIFIFHGLCILTLIICMVIWIKDYEKNKRHCFEPLSIILLSVVGFLDIFIYYKLGFREEGYFFESAVIIYTIIYSYNYGKKIKEYYYVDVSNEENINFKYIDSLTGLFNRMAFDERMYEINRSLKKYEGYVIFVFNLNNLKKVNLTLSPFKGNEYIKNNVQVLSDIFKEYGQLYRVGADEFVLIGNKNMPISKCEEMLSLYVERNMPDEKIDLIGISYGYAIVLKNSKSIYDVYNKAEINMIKLKKRLKRSNIR